MSPPRLPPTWWFYHAPGCGTAYRGCAPECPKDHYEQTGEWIGDEHVRSHLAQLIAKVEALEAYLRGDHETP
jgi:hypothetical protein